MVAASKEQVTPDGRVHDWVVRMNSLGKTTLMIEKEREMGLRDSSNDTVSERMALGNVKEFTTIADSWVLTSW